MVLGAIRRCIGDAQIRWRPRSLWSPSVLMAGLAILTQASALAGPVAAQETEVIHSDAPLWAPGSAKVWPQHLVDPNVFGCQHALMLGRWRYTTGDEETEPEAWYRFDNYGFMHCWMNISEAYEPDAFGDVRPGFLIEIGKAGEVELWALQFGARPGSDYLLLSRPPGAGPIDRFNVLQRTCSRSQVRGGRTLDILLTRYCAINTKQELIALARRMAKRPALGVLSFERE